MPRPPEKGPQPRLIDSRGRVALPRAIMEALHAFEGDFVTFVVEGEKVRICKVDWTVRR